MWNQHGGDDSVPRRGDLDQATPHVQHAAARRDR
jgi:hypothetical protein